MAEEQTLKNQRLNHEAEEVVLGDLTFCKYISHEKILEAIKRIASELNEEYRGKNPLFLAVLNGSFVFAGELMQHVDLICEVSFIKVASYRYSASTGNVRKLIGATADMEGRHVVLLEDIVDTGKTLEYLMGEMDKANAASCKVVSLFLKPDSYSGRTEIDIVGMEIENYFVVGYGMDYDEMGRNLQDLYRVKA